MILFLISVLTWLSAGSAQQIPAPKPNVRACADSWNDSATHKKKSRQKGSKKGALQGSGACVELAFSTLQIQEYLQAYARAQQWKLGPDQISEDSWTFSLDLERDELLRETAEEARNKGVEWTGGTVRVHVNTAQLPDGYTRTTVRAIFRGYGRNLDQFAVQKEYWELQSNNNLENSIVSALQNHFAASSGGSPSTQ